MIQPVVPTEHLPTTALDWEALKSSMEQQGAIRHMSMTAVAPEHPPIRVLSPMTDGIYPVR